jgi:hypothetical protein
MRIGKPLEHAQAAIKALDVSDPVVRLTAFGRQLGYAGYLIHDMLSWAHTTKVRPFTAPTIAKINQRAARFWLFGLLCSIAGGVWKEINLRQKEDSLRRVGISEKESDRKAALKTVVAQKNATTYQMVQDLLDVLLPSGTLGYHHLDDGVLGLVGCVNRPLSRSHEALIDQCTVSHRLSWVSEPKLSKFSVAPLPPSNRADSDCHTRDIRDHSKSDSYRFTSLASLFVSTSAFSSHRSKAGQTSEARVGRRFSRLMYDRALSFLARLIVSSVSVSLFAPDIAPTVPATTTYKTMAR